MPAGIRPVTGSADSTSSGGTNHRADRFLSGTAAPPNAASRSVCPPTSAAVQPVYLLPWTIGRLDQVGRSGKVRVPLAPSQPGQHRPAHRLRIPSEHRPGRTSDRGRTRPNGRRRAVRLGVERPPIAHEYRVPRRERQPHRPGHRASCRRTPPPAPPAEAEHPPASRQADPRPRDCPRRPAPSQPLSPQQQKGRPTDAAAPAWPALPDTWQARRPTAAPAHPGPGQDPSAAPATTDTPGPPRTTRTTPRVTAVAVQPGLHANLAHAGPAQVTDSQPVPAAHSFFRRRQQLPDAGQGITQARVIVEEANRRAGCRQAERHRVVAPPSRLQRGRCRANASRSSPPAYTGNPSISGSSSTGR